MLAEYLVVDRHVTGDDAGWIIRRLANAEKAEFRREMVELVKAGRTPQELSKEFEPSGEAIRNWVRQADRDGGLREDGLTTVEQEELRRLRQEVKQLRIEREILAKAATWFAREADSKPSGSSNS